MRLAHRVEDGRRVRTVEWSAASSSDLSGLVLLVAATVALPILVVCAVRTSGWERAVLTVAALGAGLLWIAVVGMLVVIGIVAGAARRGRMTPALDAVLGVVAACVGGGIGAAAYGSGPAALIVMPALAIVVAAVSWPRLRSSRARRRVVTLAAVSAIAAVVVGSSIFW